MVDYTRYFSLSPRGEGRGEGVFAEQDPHNTAALTPPLSRQRQRKLTTLSEQGTA